MLREW